VLQAAAQGNQLADRSVELGRPGLEHLPVDARTPIRREHARDLVEREAGRAPERDQREAFQHAGIEDTPQPVPPYRGDQVLLLIEAQGRGGHARAPRHLRNIQAFHA